MAERVRLIQLSRPEYPYQSPTHHADTQISPITLKSSASKTPREKSGENAFFHGYYEHRCFLPLYVFCGRHLLLAQLRPANIERARGARNQIRRIVRMIRER